MVDYATTAAVVLLGAALLVALSFLRGERVPAGLKPFNAIDGPKPEGITGLLYGNALQQGAHTGTLYPNVCINWLKWARKYGHKGFYRISNPAMNRKIIIINDPTLAGVAFARMPKDPCYKNFQCILSKEKGGFDVFSHGLEDNLWRSARKYIAPFFTVANIRSKVPVVNAKAQVMVDFLRKYGPDKPVEVQHAMKRLTMDLILETGGYGVNVNALAFGHCQELEDLSFVILEGALCSFNPWRRPYYNLFPGSKGAKNFFATHERIYALWRRIYDSIDALPPPEDGDCSLAAGIKRLAASKEGAAFTRRDLQHTAIGLLVAGLDSQALTTSFTLMCLAAHPEKQAKLAAELRQHGLLATPENPTPRQVTADDLPKLAYCDAVIREATRITPVTGLGTLRKTDKSMEMGGYHIPKGTTVQVPAYVLQMDTDSFAEVDSYIPERWLPDISPAALSKLSGGEPDEATIKAIRKEASVRQAAEEDPKAAALRLKYRLMPFSHGTRACPGYGFAMMQLTTILVNLIGTFEVSLDPSMGGWAGCHQRSLNAFTLILVGGNLMRFKPRV